MFIMLRQKVIIPSVKSYMTTVPKHRIIKALQLSNVSKSSFTFPSHLSFYNKVECANKNRRYLFSCAKQSCKDTNTVNEEPKIASQDSNGTKNSSTDLSSTTISQFEIKTNKGNLIIKTNVENSELKNVVLEKEKTALVSPEEPRDSRREVVFNNDGSSINRKFITASRALSDFLLDPEDLEQLPKINRRSPYEGEPLITVYWRKDIEEKALQKWGSKENIFREFFRREIEKKENQQNIFTTRKRLRDQRREINNQKKIVSEENTGLLGKSGKVVLIAIGVNFGNLILKTFAWVQSGSHSMFSELIHSFADTANQIMLAYGIHKSTQNPDISHPYGYTNMEYVTSLISGVGIFCIGAGLSFYHGIMGLIHPEPIENFFWAYVVFGQSLISEGFTLLVAVNKIRRSAEQKKITFKNYVFRGCDPCVNVVLAEDAAAVASIVLAASCMSLTNYTGSPVPDAIGSLLIGGILGGVASFVIYTNANALVGRSIPGEILKNINTELESDVMIRATHDIKGIEMGNSRVRYKAEIDFDGKELTRIYLEKQDLNELLKISSALRYDAYRNSIESPREPYSPTRMTWAEKLRNADINNYERSKFLSDMMETKYNRLNNTIQATLKEEPSAEDSEFCPRDGNSFLEYLKQNTSETKLHTYQYPHPNTGKGEILVHRPAPIIVRRPPTKVLINHPPLIVKPSPVIFHRPPPVVKRPVFVKPLPQKIRVEPKYVKVVKPLKKMMMKENSPSSNENISKNEYYKQTRPFY